MKIRLLSFGLLVVCSCFGQKKDPTPSKTADKSALEGIIIEKYYVSTEKDALDTTGGFLAPGSTTWRIFVDLKPGYNLQAVYGDANHELRIQTTTHFYNNSLVDAVIGYNIPGTDLNEHNFALDSWVTINSASNFHGGILRAEDTDGSVIKRDSLNKADGLTNCNLPLIKPFNMEWGFVHDRNGNLFSTKNGGWGAISGIKGGSKGPTPANKILIAQLTTTGNISFELNLQVGTPEGGVLRFVAKNPNGDEIKFEGLTHR